MQTLSSFQHKLSPHFPMFLPTLLALAHLLPAPSSWRLHGMHHHMHSLSYMEVPSVQHSSLSPRVSTSSPHPGLRPRKISGPIRIPTPTCTLSPPRRASRACAVGPNFGLAAAAQTQAGSPWAICLPHLAEIVTVGTPRTTRTSQEGGLHLLVNHSTRLTMTTTMTTRDLHIPPAGPLYRTRFPTFIPVLTLTVTRVHVLRSRCRALFMRSPCHRPRTTRRTKKARTLRLWRA
jgi:hypothetical protein